MNYFVPIVYASNNPSQAFIKVVDPFIKNILDPLVMLMFAVAIVVFFWGVIEMMIHGDDPSAREKGSFHMLFGVIGLVIMFSAWGIIYFISNTISGM